MARDLQLAKKMEEKPRKSPLSAIREAFKLSKTYEPPKDDYEKLGFFQNPFAFDIEPSDSRNASSLPDVLDLIKRIFAESQRGFDLVVFGPSGIGKTLLARSMAEAYAQGYIDWQTVYIDAATSEADLWTHLHSAELILLDNPAPIWQQLMESLGDPQDRARVAAFLTYFQYKRLTDWSKRNLGTANFPLLGTTDYRKVPIPTFSDRSIVAILQTRITNSGKDLANYGFSNEALFEIATLSMGLPLSALQIANEVLTEFARTHTQAPPNSILTITRDFVREVVRSSPHSLARALAESVNTAEIVIDDQPDSRIKLTMGTTRWEVLVAMAQDAFPRGDNTRLGPFSVERKILEQELGKPSSTISHHAQKLISVGLLQAQREANTVSYQLSSPVYHALELLSYPYLKS